jgi:hypothetical protein
VDDTLLFTKSERLLCPCPLEPDDISLHRRDCGHEGVGASVETDVNDTLILAITEHVPDTLALSVEHPVVGNKDLAACL